MESQQRVARMNLIPTPPFADFPLCPPLSETIHSEQAELRVLQPGSLALRARVFSYDSSQWERGEGENENGLFG